MVLSKLQMNHFKANQLRNSDESFRIISDHFESFRIISNHFKRLPDDCSGKNHKSASSLSQECYTLAYSLMQAQSEAHQPSD